MDSFQNFYYTCLEAATRFREIRGEALVKLVIEINDFLGYFGFHASIISQARLFLWQG